MGAGAVIASAVISAVAAKAAADKQSKAAKKAQAKEEKAQNIERAGASVENARNRRRAIAERRMRVAELTQASTDSGVQGGSALAGAASAIGAGTGSAIGAANTRIGSAFGASDLRNAGQRDLLAGEKAASNIKIAGKLGSTIAGEYSGGGSSQFSQQPWDPRIGKFGAGR